MSISLLPSVINRPQHIPLDWLQPIRADENENENDKEEEEEEEEFVLPSFVDLQKKTQATLYTVSNSSGVLLPVDKSPKGSVDEPIRPLVDLINRHFCYTTLSSCSGRISLFDPNGNGGGGGGGGVTSNTSNSNATDKATEISGKGRGGWLLVNHYPVQPSELLECFEDPKKDVATITAQQQQQPELQPWTLKLEPMLLHVAASSLPRGRQLLRLALDLGFRESGLVVTDTRVTVAIRSHSLALGIPLLPCGPLLPPKPYLIGLVEQCNAKLIQNWNLLDRLYQSIESSMFELRHQHPSSSSPTMNNFFSMVDNTTIMPPLNLWNVATVAVPAVLVASSNDSNNNSNNNDGEDFKDVQVYAFGGYGIGPSISGSPASTSSQRSSAIYQIQQRQGVWDSEWKEVQLNNNNATPTIAETTTGGQSLQVEKRTNSLSQFPDCQGMTACRLQNWIVLFGGRTSPTKPQDKLYLFDPSTHQLLVTVTADGVQGPSPRWGHTLVALSDNRRIAVIGGCDGSSTNNGGACNDIWILHHVGDTHFVWERLSICLPTPRFHHTTSRIHQATTDDEDEDDDNYKEEDVLLVLGGLGSTKQSIFDSFSAHSQGFVWACRVGATHMETMSTRVTTLDHGEKGSDPENSSWSGACRFGAASCCLIQNGGNVVVVSGGVSATDDSSPVGPPPLSVGFLQIDRNNTLKIIDLSPSYCSINKVQEQEEDDDPNKIMDFGCLVHHSCVSISHDEFLLLGGGATSFAFGDSFASSYHARFDISTQRAVDATCLRKSNVIKKSNIGGSEIAATQAKSATTNVVLVAPANAKTIKTELESRGWLDKGFRMTRLADLDQIAVPVTLQAWDQVLLLLSEDQDQRSSEAAVDGSSHSWQFHILGRGQEEMPFATAKFAAKGKKR